MCTLTEVNASFSVKINSVGLGSVLLAKNDTWFVSKHVVQRLLVLYCLSAWQGGVCIAEIGCGSVSGGTCLLPVSQGHPQPASPWEIHLPF